MEKLKAIAALLMLSIAAPTAAGPVERWRPHIDEASRRFDIPVSWIERVMAAESGGRTHWNGRPVVSRAGAMGLMQLMPGTWAEMRVRLGLGPDPHAPRDNILAGALYLRLMYDRFGYPGLFGAYNAGPARYAAWVEGRGRLPAETRAYLATVAGSARGSQMKSAAPDKMAPEKSGPVATLFFVRAGPGKIDEPANEGVRFPGGVRGAAAAQPGLFSIDNRKPASNP